MPKKRTNGLGIKKENYKKSWSGHKEQNTKTWSRYKKKNLVCAIKKKIQNPSPAPKKEKPGLAKADIASC